MQQIVDDYELKLEDQAETARLREQELQNTIQGIKDELTHEKKARELLETDLELTKSNLAEVRKS